MNSRALLAATAAILALSAVSCGKEDNESSVSVAYSEAATTVTESSEEDDKEEKTTEKTVSATETTTAATTEVSGTETTATTTVSGEETSSETTTSTGEADSAATTTTTQAAAAAPAETTAPATTETPTEDNTPAPDDNNNNDDDNNNDTTTEEPQTTEEPTTEPPTENNTFEFKFTVDNLLNDASGLLSMLGTPDYSGEAPGCTTNGNDVKIYQFDGLEVQCYIDGATEYIFSIEITGDQYETDKGIKTGASRAEVEAAYGTGETSGNMTIYYTGNNEMDIEYSGDTVTSIFFYAPV